MAFVFLPLIFVVVGVGGIIGTLIFKKKDLTKTKRAIPTQKSADQTKTSQSFDYGHGPIQLKMKQSPIARFLVVLFICLFWNGIVSVFLFAGVIPGFINGNPQWFLTIFLIPFELVGVFLLLAAAHEFLTIFNPRPVFFIDRLPLPLGSATELRWDFSRATRAVTNLTISFVGSEHATYRQGTDTQTDTHEFYREELVNASKLGDMLQGTTEVSIPADTMHSFEADHNKIEWHLEVKGVFKLWPDTSDEYAIVVVPPEGQ